MASMSYCRFENTLIDFRNCVSDLEEAETFDDLGHGEYEASARKVLYSKALAYIEEYERLQETETRVETDLSDLCYP